MLSFKRFTYTTLLITTLLSTSCLRDAKKQDGSSKAASSIDSSADFKLSTLTGTSKSSLASKDWSLPTAKTYDFRACVQTKITNTNLGPGHKFTIVLPDKSVFFADTDKYGCVAWQEKIDFNITAESKYIELLRTLRGNELYKGSIQLSIGINPWAEYRGEPGQEVVDLDKNTIPSSHIIRGENSILALTGLYKNTPGQDLLIEYDPMVEMSLIKNVNKDKVARLTIKIKPFIEPLDMTGTPTPYYFKKGTFTVYPQLVANYLGANQEKMLLAPILPKEVEISRNGLLVFQQEIVLNKEVTMGEIQLALKIEPKNAPIELNSYEGLHKLNSFKNIIGKHGASQIEGTYSGTEFNYAAFVKSVHNFKDLQEKGLAFDMPPIRFKELGIRFVRVKSGETATRRTIVYRVQTQVVDSLLGEPVIKQDFKVLKKLNNREEIIRTNDEGLLKWTDEISHLFYIPEQFYYPEVKVTHLVSNYNETLKMAINPWNSGWTFGTDYRGREEFYAEMNKQEKRESTFMIDAFRYQTIRFRYEIDQFMTLNVKKAVVMAMDPLTQRYTIEEGRKGGEPLRDGIYLVKLALVKYFIDPFKNGTKLYRDENNVHRIAKTSENDETRKGEYMTVIKKLLRVQGGRITTPLEFSMRDLRMMSIRSNIMVQIETIDEQRLLRDNIMDRKLRKLVDEYNEYHSAKMTDEDRENFIQKNDELFESERNKLITVMKKELKELQEHRLKLANAQAERFKALNDFEDRVRSERSVADRREKMNQILKMNREDFDNYVNTVRSNLDQMEKKFSSYWRQWNKDMGLPSNEIQDWVNWDGELTGNKISYNRRKYDNPDKEKIGLGENKSVYDYLASMQVFMKDFGLPEDIGEDDLKAMRLNNYTQNPAAPFIDLDLYRNNAGLKRRTFIGPCTLIANDNMSEMRPTDTIDEKYCDRIDCSQNIIDFGFHVDNSVFEQSAYHGAIKPFAMMHVDNIIELYKKHEKNYIHGAKARSQVGSFLETFNLDYISLNDNAIIKGPMKFNKSCKVDLNDNDDYDPNRFDQCYEEANERVISYESFLAKAKKLNSIGLLKEYFSYKSFDEDEEEEGLINELPSLFSRVKEAAGELFADTQEKTFGGTIGDILRNIFFVNNLNVQEYLDVVGTDEVRPLDRESLLKMLKSKEKNLSLLNAVQLCGLLSDQVAQDLYNQTLLEVRRIGPGRGRNVQTSPQDTASVIQKRCLKSLNFNPKNGMVNSSGLSFDRRYRVLETGTYEHKEGKNMNLNVGYDFQISNGKTVQIGTSISASASVSASVEKGPFAASAGVTAAKEASEADFDQMTKGSVVSAATFLVVQQATMEIELKKFERCFTATLGPELYNDLHSEDLTLGEGVKIRDKKVMRILTKGMMVCEGDYNKEPEKVIENYYYITQHFTAGDMLDEGNLLNHIWLLPLRGESDFKNFIRVVNAKEINNKGEVILDSDISFYPNARLRNNYDSILPSFPGMYTMQEFK